MKIFIIGVIQNTDPRTYTIRDLNNDLLEGFSDEQNLSPTKEVVRILLDGIIRK